jgi:surfeit locus 1 family protein
MGLDYPPPSSRRPWPWRAVVVFLAALLSVGVTARLGVWQLHRAAEKQALQDTLDTRSTQPVLAPHALARTPEQAALQYQRRVLLRGEWRPEGTVFLENRQMLGRPGFFVLTPLQLAPGDVVLVQRGWVPRDLRDRTLVPSLPLPQGTVEVLGRVAPPPPRLYDFAGPAASSPIRQNLDLAAHAQALGVPLRPLTVLQLDPPGPAAQTPDGLLRQWAAPASGVATHHGYAFQWFALCALTAGLYVWFQLIRPRFKRQA